MRSVRLDDELEDRLTDAARMTGEPASELIRSAVRRTCDEILGDSLESQLSGFIGIISVGGDATRTNDEFADILTHEHARQSKKANASARKAKAPARGKRK